MSTLGRVLDQLGVGVLEVAAAPAGIEVDITDVVIHDAAYPAVAAGSLVLGVGIDPRNAEAPATLRQLQASGAMGVIVKGNASALLDAATADDLTVLTIPTEMTWAQLHTLLRTTLATVRQAPAAVSGIALGDLFALANAVAAMVGGPTTIEDTRSTVLAYSSLDEPIDDARRDTILGRRIPDEWMQRLTDDGVFRRLYSGTDPVLLDYSDVMPGFANRLALAVRAGDEVLGSIWVADGGPGFGPDAEAALREAADLAALHLLRTRASADLERQHRGELLRAALEGRAAPESLAAAVDLGATSGVTVVAFELLESTDDASTQVRAERVMNLISLHCEAYRRAAASVAVGAVVYVLLPELGEPDRPRLEAFVRDVVTRTAEASRTPLRAAIGATVSGLRDVAQSNREAGEVLRAMRSGDTDVVGTADALRSRIVMQTLSDLTRSEPDFQAGRVAVLREHDRDKQTDYVVTLRAYLDNFGDVPAAAASLSVHPNTFRYRLRRLVEVAQLDVDDPVERLVAHLQLTLGAPSY